MAAREQPGKADWSSREPLVWVTFEDPDGRHFVVLVPSGREGNPELGIPVGPPDLSSLDLPLDVEVRLNNQLFQRGLLTLADVRRHTGDVAAAIQATLRIDVASVTALYR
jgi:hypothetical protein